MARVEMDPAELSAKVDTIFQETSMVMVNLFVREFTSYKWAWPRETVRGRGRLRTIVRSPRDIVNTGQLRNSLEGPTITREGPLRVATYIWTADYALVVHEGGTTRDGTEIPGRPWTRDPLKKAESILARIARRHI